MRFFVVLLSGFLLLPGAHADDGGAGERLIALLPAESELSGWSLAGAPETAEGVELFSLINGGAELYVQAGFERALMATFRKQEGKAINLDIFEMASRDAAELVHRRKIGSGGKPLSIGDGAVLKDYYLNVLAGRFQVTLSGYDSDEETVRMLEEMAGLVAEGIHRMQEKAGATSP